jgi:CubicO group peptidase (beta-lactamase class C family)
VDNGADFDPGITTPNGGWNAPLGDLAKYVAFLTDAVVPGMSRDRYNVVLSRTSLEEMWRPVQPMSQSYEAAPEEWMGLSFFILQRGGIKLLGHTGSQAGFRSFMFFNPQNRTGIVAAFNTTNFVAPATTAFERMRNAGLDLLR